MTDLALILLGAALCWAFFDLASQIMDQGVALLATAIYLVFIYGRILDATHHWFSILAIACALRVLMPARSTIRVATAGGLLGLACFFTQTSGALALAALLLALTLEHFFLQRPWREIVKLQAVLVASFLVVWLAESVPFLITVGWKQLWYLWITYASHNVVYTQHFLAPATIRAEAHKSVTTFLQRFGILGLMLSIYPLAIWHRFRRRTRPEFQHSMQLLLLALPGFLLMIEVMIKPNWNRIYMASLPAFLLFAWWIAEWKGRARRTGIVLLWTVTICSGLSQTLSAHRHARVALDLPAGRAIPLDPKYNPEFQWLSQNTKPGDYMLQAAWLNTYLPLKLRDPVYIDGLWPGPKTPPQYVQLAAIQVEEKRVEYVLWSPGQIDWAGRPEIWTQSPRLIESVSRIPIAALPADSDLSQRR